MFPIRERFGFGRIAEKQEVIAKAPQKEKKIWKSFFLFTLKLIFEAGNTKINALTAKDQLLTLPYGFL